MPKAETAKNRLNVYQVTVDGTPVFELVAETVEKARNLLASRLRNLQDHGVVSPPSPRECSVEPIGQVTADGAH